MITNRQELSVDLPSLYEQAFENATRGLGVARPDGSWIKVNQAFCRLTGYEAHELMKQTVKTVTHPDDLERAQGLFDRLIQGKIDSYSLRKKICPKEWKYHLGCAEQQKGDRS